jgi:2-succinyl-5-enolpyruvyl-6-hydroxy-3-cyclohexene-1-carboxylate synthase
VLAEPTSGVRSGTDKQGRTNVIAHYDLLVRSEAFASERPDVVIRVGEMPTSKPLRAWLERCRQIVIDPHFDWHDPTRSAESIMAVGPEALAAAATEDARGGDAEAPVGDRPGAWLARWLDADAIVAEELARSDEPFEPLAYNVLADLAELIWVSSSLPIRDFESYFPRTDRPLTILSNRGANGIDGVVSSAAGASISADKPAYLVIGELALLHDIGGLVSARRAGAELAILCVNNGGGGIFDFLPVAEQADREPYEDHIATPVDFDVATAARLGGLEHRRATTAAEVREHLRPGALVEFIIDRPTSLQRHRDSAARIVKRLDTA